MTLSNFTSCRNSVQQYILQKDIPDKVDPSTLLNFAATPPPAPSIRNVHSCETEAMTYHEEQMSLQKHIKKNLLFSLVTRG